ncbi:MAG: MBL fold metallo-hydrolase [Clostridia bacterium]|jgi:glyoxylase-like metal-dependent hydrolase (beta-lactamase superfamily II)
MRIADGLEMLEIRREGGGPGALNLTLIWDEGGAVLVDAGLPGQLDTIRKAMEEAGVPFESLKRVIITHHDMDHIGSLSSVVKALDNKVEVLAHEGEKPYIQGEKLPIKMTPERLAQREAQLKALPEKERKAMQAMYDSIPTKVDRTVEDGEELPYCGGIVIIHTPGHTPGHICLYLKKYKALVTGDAMNLMDGKLVGPNPVYTFDMDLARESLKKLSRYDIEKVICYHGGLYQDNLNQRITELV